MNIKTQQSNAKKKQKKNSETKSLYSWILDLLKGARFISALLVSLGDSLKKQKRHSTSDVLKKLYLETQHLYDILLALTCSRFGSVTRCGFGIRTWHWSVFCIDSGKWTVTSVVGRKKIMILHKIIKQLAWFRDPTWCCHIHDQFKVNHLLCCNTYKVISRMFFCSCHFQELDECDICHGINFLSYCIKSYHAPMFTKR